MGLNDEKKELLNKSRLSIWLDNYDDVFSDFDPRPYNERALSDDFLNEVRKMTREKPSGNVELKLLIPTGRRQTETEAIIIKNLHAHFRHFAQNIQTEMGRVARKGYLMTASGLALMIITAFVTTISGTGFYWNALKIILEPAGWFLVWTGLDNIFSNPRQRQPSLDFNTKMAHAEITFLPY